MASDSEALAIAIGHHQAGNLPAAERIYRQLLADDPNHADALHLLGVLALQMGQHEAAVESISRAIEVNGNEAAFHSNLGNAFKAQGKVDAAIGCFQRAVELQPDSAAGHYNLGNALQAQGKLDEAMAHFQCAIGLQPDYAMAHNNLGNALLAQGKAKEAVVCIRRAIELQPELVEAHYNLGTAFQAQKKLEEAIGCFRRAIELQPDLAEAHYNLGTAYQGQRKSAEAAACYRRAVELKPDDAAAHNNLGTAYQSLRKLDEAIACFSRALELKPDFAEGFSNRASLRLLVGDFERGWADYEWRWKTKELVDRKFSEPRWDGSPLGDRTILVYAEQGYGDTLQFVRYAALVKKQNPRATVVFECQRRLDQLLARCRGIDRLIVEGSELPPFDVQCPLLSLPGILHTTLETVPAEVPYLFAEAALVAAWRERLSGVGGFRVGINWSGRPGSGEFLKRNIPLELFATLAQVPGVRLVSLQKGEARDELVRAGGRLPILDLGDDFDTPERPFMDTAAVMKNLDLVITSDTSVPHLAGGLGVPVWLALPFASDWRWLLERSDNPWYPTMRLFRQKEAGEWNSVYEEIRGELGNLASRAR